MIKQLGAFATGYFQFFFNGFSENPNLDIGPRLSESDIYQANYVLRQVVDRLAIDLQVMERIVLERMLNKPSGAPNKSGEPYVPHTLDTLLRADELAKQALQPAIDLNLIDPKTTAITYFQKTADIRVIPYASVALVGIPMSSVLQRQDLLAIPHEIGHYVYWNGRYNFTGHGARIHKRLNTFKKDMSPWLKNWIEEIFADVYGAMVCGSAGAHGIQLVENEASKDQFIEDDLEHPTPLVRPLIYNRVLQYRFWQTPPANDDDAVLPAAEQSTMQLMTLMESWRTISAGRTDATLLKLLPDKDSEQELAISDIKKEMLYAVDGMLTGLFNGKMGAWLWDKDQGKMATWPAEIANTLALEAVVSQAKAALEEPAGADLSSQSAPAPDAQVWDNWKTSWKQSYVVPNGDVLPGKWLELLRSEAWTTEGPHGRDRDGG
ncbi:MAG: hypothetical protein H7175_23775 [Burkholderiales bacterium]|nr:hypothetical protein [Anaerolineae bacterium]